MNLRNIFVPVGGGLVVVGFRLLWLAGCGGRGGRRGHVGLLHFTRLMNVLRKAANRPIGMWAAPSCSMPGCKPGVSLMHVMAMTRSLGALQSPENAQPEVYRWTTAPARM
jgi:hypothetical protein